MSDPISLDFDEFFRELYGDCPFPWQRRLAQRVCKGNWPQYIALPTSAGKTACIDIAVFAMAWQADRPADKRTAPRRVFFVVDRRVVVDQALDHAKHLSEKLKSAKNGTLREVADRLRKLGGLERPLDCYALRGGMYRESAWVRSPLQPTVITSTVDQVGSRLLFRGYGVTDSSRPLHAALVGNDALILLDEAHCSKPFEQTMNLIKKYRGWAAEPLPSPFHFVSMTATPSAPKAGQIERDEEDDRTHPQLGRRIAASKPATLVVASKATGKNWRGPLVKELAAQARRLAEEGFAAVGVIVNRVATARELAKELAGAVLLTGRMRPMDRDELLERKLRPLLSNSKCADAPPQFVVATQCIEVGADFDFHALVTECASMDALRQRFGRLNRVAARDNCQAVIVIREDQSAPARTEQAADPIYGDSIAETWKWLHGNRDGTTPSGLPWIDFGVASIRQKWDQTTEDIQALLSAPASDAAVLLPAHLDMFCQTAPVPAPDPDPAVFLHGPQPRMIDVQVVFRDDLGDVENRDQWREIVSLCPPSTAETLSVPINVFRTWLAKEQTEQIADDTSDVEGQVPRDGEVPGNGIRWVLCWEGPTSNQTKPVSTPGEIRPNATYVVPLKENTDYSLLGDFPNGRPTDLGDPAFQRARDRAILRPNVRADYSEKLPQAVDDPDFDQKLEEALEVLANDNREWVQTALQHLKFESKRLVREHPLGRVVLIGRKRLRQFDPTFVEADDSWEYTTAVPLLLANHCSDVADAATRFARGAGLNNELANVLQQAGQYHDAGKADPRFQAWMHGGNARRAAACSQPFAKAIVPMPSLSDRNAARNRTDLPKGFRHEMLSVQLAEATGLLCHSPQLRELFLHLIAAHHGHARPLAPVVSDGNLQSIRFNGTFLSADQRAGLIPPHRLDSGIAERFWTLTRRFGWWGLPWLEAMLRLADWAASDDAERMATDD